MPQRLPMLTGFRVLDFTQIVAGPTCCRILAEMGAEVIKVELPPGGDRVRERPYKPRDPVFKNTTQSSYYFQHNHSKKSLAIDYKSPRGHQLIEAMLPKIDVVVENFAPGVMARSKFGYEDLRKINPAIIMCSISMAGQTGPLRDQPGYDFVGQAYAGITSLIGEPDRGPAQTTMALGDISTGVAAAMAVGFALLHRERTGEGQYIDASIIDTYFHMHEQNVPKISMNPGFVPQRSGSRHPDGTAGNYHFKDDDWIYLVILNHQWPQLVKALGRPELLNDPRFHSARARRDNDEAFKDLIEEWLGTFPTRQAALEALQKERVPCAPVLTLNEAMQHPHLRERKTVRRVNDPILGEFDLPGMPVKFSAWPDRTDLKADQLGEHNEAVLRELAGVSDADLEQLYADGVLVRDPLIGRTPPAAR